MTPEDYLKKRLDPEQFEKIKGIDNLELNEFLAKYIELLNPARVFICTDSKEDEDYIRRKAIE